MSPINGNVQQPGIKEKLGIESYKFLLHGKGSFEGFFTGIFGADAGSLVR